MKDSYHASQLRHNRYLNSVIENKDQ